MLNVHVKGAAAGKVQLPSVVAPSRKFTVPAGVPAPGAVTVTVAVKVTLCPKTDGFADDVTIVVVVAFATVRGSQGLVARLLLVSPLYVALILNEPAAVGVTVFESGTTPLVTVTLPAAVRVPVQVPVFQNE